MDYCCAVNSTLSVINRAVDSALSSLRTYFVNGAVPVADSKLNFTIFST